jgi:transposase
LGNPLRLILTAGQESDVTQGAPLIKDLAAQASIADKGYDLDALVKTITVQQAQAVIPPCSNRKEQREYDWHLYRERHLVECFIGKIKHYRRVFSRFEKLSKSYLGFLSFVSALIWLR